MGYYDELMRLEAARRRASRGLSGRERVEDELPQVWYTVPEAAEELEEHPKTVYARVRSGELKAQRWSERKIRIHYTELARYMSKEGGKNSE